MSFVGAYDPPTAARYLRASQDASFASSRFSVKYRVTSRTLRYWIQLGLADSKLVGRGGHDVTLDFSDLISVRIVAMLRSMGVNWLEIRRAERYLSDLLKTDRPFAHKAIWSDTEQVMTTHHDRLITASMYGQLAMPEIVHQYLRPVSGLDFMGSEPISWAPRNDSVLLNPKIQSGAPCIAKTRIPTKTIANLVRAGDSEEFVANMYGLSHQQLRDALAWENSLAA